MRGNWLRRPDTATPSTAVVFVHGILSENEKCWLHANGTYWPRLLAERETVSKIGIYEFTYQTGIFSGSYSLGNVVEALKETLALDGVLAANRIIFVAHSMGGIVVRRYIVQRASELMEFGTEIGLFLVASPSLGSSYANWLAPIARFMGHQQAAALTFSQNNSWLNDLNTDFRNMLARRKLIIYGKELVEDRFVILKRFGLFEQVVPPLTGATFFGEAFKVPNSDHFSIAKPESSDAIQSRLLCQFVEMIVQTSFDLRNVHEGTGELRTVVNRCEICVVAGRIEDYPAADGTVVALPCDEYFDVCIGDRRTTLGTYVERHFVGRSSDFEALTRDECKRKFGHGVNQQKTNDTVAESGTCQRL